MSGNPPPAGQRPETGIAELFAEQLRRIALAQGQEARTKAIDDLAMSVSSTNSAVPFLTRLLSEDRHGQRLALEIVLRLPLPLSEEVCRLIQPVMANTKFSTPLRLNVAIQVFRSIEEQSPLLPELLNGLLADLDSSRAVERLRFLLSHMPHHPVLEKRRQELEEKAAIACSKCGVRLQRPEMVVHLWQKHRLLMDGARARDPWKMIEDWLSEYARTGRPELLERSCELGQQLDALGGLTRVHRLLLAAGLTDDEARENLTAQAEGGRASLCPHCYALVPPSHEPLPPPMNLSRGRIAGNGCIVEVSDRYLFTRLFTATNDRILHDGSEPGHGLTRRGLALAQLGPLVLIALALAIFMPPNVLPPLTPVAIVLLAALLLYFRIRQRDDTDGDPAQRAVEHAWEFLAPEMHRPVFSPDDADFLSRLAVTSIGVGSPDERIKSLERVIKITHPQVLRGHISAGHLAALRCLEIDDAIRLDNDPIPILVKELAMCLHGEMPLIYGEQLLEAWPQDARDPGQRARLRVLLCASAFEHGFEARDLHEFGRVSGLFGQAMGSDDLEALAGLRWLWNHRADRVWQRNGAASTVFDLARYSTIGGQYLELQPDLLLFQPMSVPGGSRDASEPILVAASGVYYRDLVVRNPDVPIEIDHMDGSYDLVVGKQTLSGFQVEPRLLADRLRGWMRFLVREFRPSAQSLMELVDPDRLRPLLDQKAMNCPECGNSFLAMSGAVGMIN